MAMNRVRSFCRLFIPFMQCLNYQCLPFRCVGNVFIIFYPEMCQVNIKAKCILMGIDFE